jgi:Fe-S cluster assembly protein SufD
MRTDSILTGQGGRAELLAAFFGDRDQMHDFRTLQEHVAPKTTSDLVFKGAVAGTARSVYTGLIHMRKGAKGANAFQTNRNLVLSEGAHADSVPNLDIEENDVRCSHASAVGPVDTQQRFYLESRGVPGAVAERLIVLGFFAELLERVHPSVRDFVLSNITERGRAVMA